tara:strand:- start:379 stop:789 length:411 start_codon:yes stop_codon:yes gene_type:complete
MLQYLALLFTSALFGGMLLFSFGFAPIVFHALSSDEAGKFIRIAFPWYYIFIILTAALSFLTLLPLNSISATLMAGILVIGIFARQFLMPKINTFRDLQLKGDKKAGGYFAKLHALSVFLNFSQLAITGYILICFL